MTTKLLYAVAAIALSVGVAHAAEGNGDPFGLEGANLPVTANPIEMQTGQAAYPAFSRRVQVAETVGGTIPANGSQGVVESPNSLPSAPEIGGIWPAANPQAASSAAG